MRALAACAAVVLSAATAGAASAPIALRGFSAPSSARERAVEAQFADIPSAAGALELAAQIEARPHYAGSAGDYALAVTMRDRLRADGIEAELEAFTTRVDTPRSLALAIAPAPDDPALDGGRGAHGRRRAAADFPIALDLREIPEPSDPPTSSREVGIPFNAGSADGDVRAPLVYADRGLDADYATLANAGVAVAGAVVLVRYGAEFRGLLAERAQAHGAAGVIFYSDPKDDGAARGPVYPDGPWRPSTAVQRGSVGGGIRIPTLPVSAANARILLAGMRGASGPDGWGGALPVSYPLARGPLRVHLTVKLERKPTTLWNTIGIIAGRQGDQSVILGAHRDAWVYGVGDNGDGVTTMLEVARGLGFLRAGGWRPERTIVIAGWDGEEIGLAGSREYTRRHHAELQRGCVAYINADQNVTGDQFGADAAAAIAPIVGDAAHAIEDPAQPSRSIYDRWAAQRLPGRLHVEDPGGGSDHEPFLFGEGIPIANIGFSGPFGVYHASADTLRYAVRWSDPQFALHRATAQYYGIVALRLADAEAVPYAFGGYVGVLRAGIARARERAAGDGMSIEFGPLSRAVDRFAKAAVRFDALLARMSTLGDADQRELRAVHDIDRIAYGVRGYAAVTFPRLDEALASRDATAIDMTLRTTAAGVDRAVANLTR